MSRLLILAVALLATGCGQTAAGARALALEAGAVWVGPHAIRSIASGSATPDGPEVLWLADERRVFEVTDQGTSEEVWKPPQFGRLLRLEAADLDGDGAEEWIVTVDAGRIRSFVVRRTADGAEEVARTAGFLRPVVGPEGTVVLLAQSAGAESPYSGPVKRAALNGGAISAGEALDLPRTLSLHDIAFLPVEGGHRLFTYEPTGHLGERDPRSPRASLWRSDVRMVARPVEVERRYGNLLGEELQDSLALPVPPVVADLDGDGAEEVLLVAGTTTPVAVLQNVRVLQGGDARVMKPGARGLVEHVRSPLLGRAMVGVVPWAHRGRSVLAAAVWTRADTGFARPETRVFLMDPATGDLVGLEEPPPVKEPSPLKEAAPTEESIPPEEAGEP